MAKISFLIIILVVNQSLADVVPATNKLCISGGYCYKGTEVIEPNFKKYQAYFGIPYADPPIGPLRFKKPHNPPVPPGIWDCTYVRNQCKQVIPLSMVTIGSEDCLYLNVYTPRLSKMKRLKEQLPVLVFFHGGAFRFGSATKLSYGPEHLLKDSKLIIVTVQFRMGVFGFLSAGNKHCRGNFGLYDQNKAMRWIHDNIHNFGGDPNRITLMGANSGSVAAQLHMMSKKSNDLFQRLIMLSGSFRGSFGMEKYPKDQFKRFVTLAGLDPTDSTEDLMDSLRQMTADQLQQFSDQIEGSEGHPFIPVFAPVLDNSFLTEDPEVTWKTGNYQHRPMLFLLGSNEQGTFGDIANDPESVIRQALLKDFTKTMERVFKIAHVSQRPILEYYFGQMTPKEGKIKNMTNVIRDWQFYLPLFEDIQEAVLVNKETDINLLFFNFVTKFNLPIFHDYGQPQEGPTFTELLFYLFRMPLFESYVSSSEKEKVQEARELLIQLITQYVERGFDYYDSFERCTGKSMINGVCDYLEITNGVDDHAELVLSHKVDMKAMRIMQAVSALNKYKELGKA